jgi:hypothetical protein
MGFYLRVITCRIRENRQKVMNCFKKIQSLDKSEKEDVLRAIDMILKGTGSK